MIRRACKDVSELIDAFLILGREPKRLADSEAVNVAEVAEAELAKLAPLVGDKGIELELDAKAELRVPVHRKASRQLRAANSATMPKTTAHDPPRQTVRSQRVARNLAGKTLLHLAVKLFRLLPAAFLLVLSGQGEPLAFRVELEGLFESLVGFLPLAQHGQRLARVDVQKVAVTFRVWRTEKIDVQTWWHGLLASLSRGRFPQIASLLYRDRSQSEQLANFVTPDRRYGGTLWKKQ